MKKHKSKKAPGGIKKAKGKDGKKYASSRKARREERDLEIQRLSQLYHSFDASSAESFLTYPLSAATQKGLSKHSYTVPTEIQKLAIIPALKGIDILGAAKTGSGKTLAFLIPTLELLYRKNWSKLDGLGALIITPTRELAYQIFEVLRKVGSFHDFSAGLVIGGKDLVFERERMGGINILICTPGRLLQHMDENYDMDCNGLQILVLDEADRILDMGFKDTMNAVIQNLPSTRQTLLFSATQTKSVADLARLSLVSPLTISAHMSSKTATPKALKQAFVIVKPNEKLDVLYSFIKSHLHCKTLIFLSTCKQVKFVMESFSKLRPGISLMQLHGKLNQLRRLEIYDSFCRKQHVVLFATDLAGRGLDFPSVDWVVQVDCPEDIDTYIHRVGRTARFEKGGESLLMLTPHEMPPMLDLFREGRIPITELKINPSKIRTIQGKLQSFLAEDVELKESGQRAFVAYIKSIHLMKNKKVFDVNQVQLESLALSMGLLATPRLRFLKKALQGKQLLDIRAEREKGQQEGSSSLNLVKDVKDGGEDDIMILKRRNVELDSELNPSLEPPPAKKPGPTTRVHAAKKLLKKNIKINSRVVFDEEGNTETFLGDSNIPLQASQSDYVEGLDLTLAKQSMLLANKEDLARKKKLLKEKKILKRHKLMVASCEDTEVGVRLGSFQQSDMEDQSDHSDANHSDQSNYAQSDYSDADQSDHSDAHQSDYSEVDKSHQSNKNISKDTLSSLESEDSADSETDVPAPKKNRLKGPSKVGDWSVVAEKRLDRLTGLDVLDTGCSLEEDESIALQLLCS